MELEAFLSVCDGLEQWFSTRGPFRPLGHLPMSGDIFAYPQLGVATGI